MTIGNCIIGYEGTRIRAFIDEPRYSIGKIYYVEDEKYYYILRLSSITTVYPKNHINLIDFMNGKQINEEITLIKDFYFSCLLDLIDIIDKNNFKKIHNIILPRIGGKLKSLEENQKLSKLYDLDFDFKEKFSDIFKKHCLVVGASGSGKSSFVKKLLDSSLVNDYIVFDFHGEYKNSKKPLIKESDVKPCVISELIEASLPQFELLNVCYKYFGDNWISQGKNISKLSLLKRMFQDSTISVVRRHLMEISNFSSISNEWSILDYINDDLVINLKNCNLKEVELLILTILHYLFTNNISKTIIIEEAHNIKIKNNIIEKLFREGRKFSINCILVTQTPSILPSSIITNVDTMVCFRLRDRREFEFIKGIVPNLFVSELEIKSLDDLFGLLFSTSFKLPLRVKL